MILMMIKVKVTILWILIWINKKIFQNQCFKITWINMAISWQQCSPSTNGAHQSRLRIVKWERRRIIIELDQIAVQINQMVSKLKDHIKTNWIKALTVHFSTDLAIAKSPSWKTNFNQSSRRIWATRSSWNNWWHWRRSLRKVTQVMMFLKK